MANIINGTDTGSGGLITTGDSSDELQLQTAEVARVTLTNTAVVVNESGADVDFRVEGDTDANLLFVDAGNDRVGIGTSSPAQKLDVSGQLKVINGGDGFFINPNASDTRLVTSGTLPLTFRPNDTERMRIDSSGNVSVANGNLAFSTNGTGIDFSASAGGGATSSLLDDYEEGTFTPTVFIDSTEVTSYHFQYGSYTKVGRIVHLNLWVRVNNKGAATGNVSIRGLPFTCANGNDFYTAGTLGYQDEMSSSSAPIYVYLPSNSLNIFLNYATATSVTNVTQANLNAGQIMVQISYPAA